MRLAFCIYLFCTYYTLYVASIYWYIITSTICTQLFFTYMLNQCFVMSNLCKIPGNYHQQDFQGLTEVLWKVHHRKKKLFLNKGITLSNKWRFSIFPLPLRCFSSTSPTPWENLNLQWLISIIWIFLKSTKTRSITLFLYSNNYLVVNTATVKVLTFDLFQKENFKILWTLPASIKIYVHF